MSDEQPTLEVPVPTPAEQPAPPVASAPEPAAEAKPEEAQAPPESPPPAPPEAGEPAPEPPSNKKWYVVKVQSGREESIKEAIERRVKIEGLEECYGQIVIPTEKVVEMRNNKRVTRERKLYPGYLMAEVEYNDRILYLFRETSGVGDFVGGGVNKAPPPMSQREIDKVMRPKAGKDEPGRVVQQKAPFGPGERVKINQGVFSGMEGDVKEILEAKGQVRVEVTIFGRPVSVELEYWQVDPV
jgi:transcriptional antiterminator NusG